MREKEPEPEPEDNAFPGMRVLVCACLGVPNLSGVCLYLFLKG